MSLLFDPIPISVTERAICSYLKGDHLQVEFKEVRELNPYKYLGHQEAYAKFFLDIQIAAEGRQHSVAESIRIDVPRYAMALAMIASMRSEDPVRKVGAIALDAENRVIATAYNGLAKGQEVDHSWWDDDIRRRKYVIHAEANLCSLTLRGQVDSVAVTTMPCGPCALNLVAHGVKRVYFGADYPTDPSGREILGMHHVQAIHVPLSPVSMLIQSFILPASRA